ncbi:MAG: hypothetical protein IPH53_07620 [Flavobacteriales bacterium]|nr:hypothetical protein [Flavobacteriales bacterium]
MGDVNGDVTTVLERAASTINDNRLVPQGFSTAHYAYDTTRIEGVPQLTSTSITMRSVSKAMAVTSRATTSR